MSTLHITNGSCAGDLLQTFVDGPVVLMCDVLHEGPAPPVDGDAWHRTRAKVLADEFQSNVEEIRAGLARSDRAIADAVGHDDIVLWFEHDLFDQLELIRTLDLLVRAGRVLSDPAIVSLICIDRFPGVERFIGLGQLTRDQLASLYPTRAPVTARQYATAADAWNAFRSPDPAALLGIAVRLKADTTYGRELPFLGDALLRLLAEYPSTTNGLSRTEQLALRELYPAPMTGWALFAATQRHEPRPFLGDETFYDTLRALASARVPLVAVDAPPNTLDLRERVVSITPAGRDVVTGQRDHVALNGIDRWKGGVHLVGADRSPWRWDESRETLIS